MQKNIFTAIAKGKDFETLLELEGRSIDGGEGTEVRLAKEKLPEGTVTLEFLPEFLIAHAGEAGYMVTPSSLEKPRPGSQICRFIEREDAQHKFSLPLMPIYGMVRGGKGTLVIIEGMNLSFSLELILADGKYVLYPVFYFTELPPHEDIVACIIELNGTEASYSGMAKRYREYQLKRGFCKPLEERSETQPILNYAIEAFSIRIRHGWKPRPTQVLHQTPENEPPMYTAIDFERTIKLMEMFKQHGIEKAEFCLVGWNKSGHDGRFPQHFPVEAQLGGEEGLKKVIAKGNELGYPVDLFTNSTGAYEVADCWDEEFIAKKKDGSLHLRGTTGSGVAHRVCAQRAFERSDSELLPRIAAMGVRGLHYIDVQTVVPPTICHDPRHPANMSQWVEWSKKTMRLSRELFGGYSSEGGYDCYADCLDYALYINFGQLEPKMSLCDERIPLWQLVYHGIILSNPSAETVNYPVKGPLEKLTCIEYGARPVMYYYSKFCASGMNWMGEKDLICDTDEEMEESVSSIKKAYDEYMKLAWLQKEFMEEHEILSDNVRYVRYSGGTEIVVNYGETPFTFREKEVPPQDYIVIEVIERK
ncbi:MAG: DUF5696 domain-containing protein [Eubacteriales bacterium]|nr:DUF5696 domain-containing protein [Eubacteriales bacterium]